MEEARSITQVEIAPNGYAVVNLRNGIPELPQAVAAQYDVRKNPDGSWIIARDANLLTQQQPESPGQDAG